MFLKVFFLTLSKVVHMLKPYSVSIFRLSYRHPCQDWAQSAFSSICIYVIMLLRIEKWEERRQGDLYLVNVIPDASMVAN